MGKLTRNNNQYQTKRGFTRKPSAGGKAAKLNIKTA
jgi:hypothetical protein